MDFVQDVSTKCSVFIATSADGYIAEVAVLIDSDAHTTVAIKDKQNQTSLLIIANQDASSSKSHKLKIGNKTVRWQGPYHLTTQLLPLILLELFGD